jgi:glycosyltransferase involved in cell wall biosynthesis
MFSASSITWKGSSFLYAGAHGMSNDLGTLLQAAGQLRDREEIQFVLVGDGKEKNNLQTQAASLNLENVHFLPPVPKDQMGEILAAADAGIALLKPLDLYKTTYPNKVFDYMAAARPVILAIDGVIRQVVEEAGAGIAVAPGDPAAIAQAACQMASQPEKSRAMGLSGRKYLEAHFNRQDLAEKLSQLLLDMRGKHGR